MAKNLSVAGAAEMCIPGEAEVRGAGREVSEGHEEGRGRAGVRASLLKVG